MQAKWLNFDVGSMLSGKDLMSGNPIRTHRALPGQEGMCIVQLWERKSTGCVLLIVLLQSVIPSSFSVRFVRSVLYFQGTGSRLGEWGGVMVSNIPGSFCYRHVCVVYSIPGTLTTFLQNNLNWIFEKYSVKILCAVIDWVWLGIPISCVVGYSSTCPIHVHPCSMAKYPDSQLPQKLFKPENGSLWQCLITYLKDKKMCKIFSLYQEVRAHDMLCSIVQFKMFGFYFCYFVMLHIIRQWML